MPTPWQIAIESKDIKKIQDVLANGYVPENLRASIIVNSYFADGEERILSITKILLESDSVDCYKIAEKFVELGAELPSPRKNHSDFQIVSEYLNHLAHSKHDLFIALQTDPNLMNLRDERQATLLHHVAGVGLKYKDNSALLILSQVLLPTANFQAQDRDGITPMHRVAAYSHEKVTRRTVIPSFITAALKSKNGFNFKTKDYRGHTFFDVIEIVAPQRISNVDEYIKSLKSSCIKPFAEVRKNTRVLLGPKKPGKEGTLSVLPIEILMMILGKTNDIFNEIEESKKNELIIGYSKRPKIPSKMSIALSSVSEFLNNRVPRFDSWRETFGNVTANIFMNILVIYVAFSRIHSERQALQIQELQRPLTRFEQARNTIVVIAIFLHCIQVFFETTGKNYLNNDALVMITGSSPSTASFRERFRETPFTSSIQMLSGALMMIVCVMMFIERTHEQLPNMKNFLVRTRDGAYAFWNEVGGANNPTRDAVLNEIPGALDGTPVNREGNPVLH